MPPVSEVEVAVPGEGAGGLSREDCLCPVCLEIFLEPVTLPCTHTFCKTCFLETVDKANMCCPLCRKRVSNWARRNSKNKTLVNVDLWQRIQNAFPEQCQKRMNGQEDDYSILVTTPQVCQPGELRREYENEVSKLEKERQALEEAEQRASEEYIQRLLAEEEQQLAEERSRQEQSQQQDELLARRLSQELNSSDPVSHTSSRPVEISPLQKKRPGAGDIQKFFSPARNKHTSASDSSPSSSLLANKENMWTLERSTLLPQRCDSRVSQDLPALDYYGPPAHSASSSRRFPDHLYSSPCSPYSISSSSDFELTDIQSPERSNSSTSAKRKSGQIEFEDEGTAAPKRPCAAPSMAEALGPSMLQQLTQQEEELQERRRQEEEDRQLALQLQRELDREERKERSRATEGHSYQLRQKTPPSAAGDSAATPLKPHITHHSSSTGGEGKAGKAAGGQRQDQGKTPKRRRSAPPAPASSSFTPGRAATTTTTPGPAAAANSAATPLKKDCKQVTIKDLFNLLSS